MGTLELAVPRVRDGGCVSSLLEPRKRAERALPAVVQEAYVHGVSTRRVDDLVKALGLDGISMSQVSRLGAELRRFRTRRLDGRYPYVWLDATSVKVRLVGAILLDQHDEWQVGRRYFSAESPAKLIQPREEFTLPILVAS